MFQYFLDTAMFPSLVWAIRITGYWFLWQVISSAVVSRIWDILPAVDSYIGMKGLNRINDYNFGLDRFNLFEDVFWVLVSVRM
jgi:hypothetical protein